jgi:hypothetical protein
MNPKGGIFIKLIIGVMGAVALVSTAHARSKPLIDPPETQSRCTVSEEQMLQGITQGLIGRDWLVTGRQPGLVTAQLIVRGKHTLIVTIKYTDTSFDIDYEDSVNLNYRVDDDGTQYLHPNGSIWLEDVRRGITKQLEYLCTLE